MKARVTKTKIVFTGVLNESLLECIATPAQAAGCKLDAQDFGTKQIVVGTPEQLQKFIDIYNS